MEQRPEIACELTVAEINYLCRFSHSPPGSFGGLLKVCSRPKSLELLKESYRIFNKLVAIEGVKQWNATKEAKECLTS